MSVSASPRTNARLFTGMLLLSGFCGISYEILYARLIGNLLGDQFAVSATVLLTFLLGIGCGALYAHRFWRHLWLLEAAIGLCGVVYACGLHSIDTWLYKGLPLVGAGLASTVVQCFVLLSPPAFLIGCSLPLFAGYFSCMQPTSQFARTYTVYNFGAALTALGIEFWLLRALGLRGAVFSIAAVNGLVAAGLVIAFRDLRGARPLLPSNIRLPAPQVIALALTSVASAIFQLLMIKIAESVLGPFRETFALVLCLTLFGIAFGSALTARYKLTFGTLLVINLIGLGWLLSGFGLVTHGYARLYALATASDTLVLTLKIAALALLMGLPALSFGATIPALLTTSANMARASGQLLFVSSVANAVGFLCMAFFLHRYLDYGILILTIATLSSASLLLFWWPFSRRRLASITLLLALFGVHRAFWHESLLYLGHTVFHDPSDLQEAQRDVDFSEAFKGYQDVFAINWIGGRPFFFINGYVSMPLDAPSEKLVGAFAALFAPRTDQALVLGVGSGATAGTVGLLFDHTDAVEINPVVLKNLYRMAAYNFDIESQPHLSLIHDDAIHFAKTTDKTYSLIINTVTTPLYFSSSKLYTSDFFETIRQRLRPDGLYVTWFDSRVGEYGLDMILKTLAQSFAACGLGTIKASYFLLLCSPQPIQLHQPRLATEQPELARQFREAYGLFPQWLPYGLLSTQVLAPTSAPDVPLNTLDYPALEFEMARLRKRGIEGFKKHLLTHLQLEDVATALQRTMAFDPVHLVLHHDMLLGESALTARWRHLVSQQVADFSRHYDDAKLDAAAEYAAAVHTAEAHHHYGYQLLHHGRYQDAITEFRQALHLNPAYDNANFNLAACYEKLGQLQSALAHYKQELSVDPEDDEVPFRLGRVYLKLKRYEEALAAFEIALSISAKSEVYVYRGQVFEALGRLEQARQAYTEARDRALDDEDVLVAVNRLHRLTQRRNTHAH